MKTHKVLHIENQTNKKGTKSTEKDDFKNKMSNFCLDVAKYTLTGIFLATIFVLIEDLVLVLIISGTLIIIFIFLGMSLNKSK
jgi:hypothetical protein